MALNLEVNILGEYRNLTKATKGATKELRGLQTSVGRISRGINAALATIGVGLSIGALKNTIKGVVNEASNLAESVNAVTVSFGRSADAVLELGKTSATALGIAQSDFNAAAVKFSSFADSIVGDGGNAAEFIEAITQRGADFASVYNIDVAEALRVFQSGLAGEAEPLKRFGFNLLDTEVKAYAAANGIGEVGRELNASEKVLARYQLLMELTAKTQGDFQNTSDGLANGLRILRANFKDARAEVGDAFLPILSELVDTVNDNIDVFDDLATAISDKITKSFEEGGLSAETFGARIVDTLTDLTEFLNGTADADNSFVKLQQDIEPILDLLIAFRELGKGVITVLDGIFQGLFGWISLIPGVDSSIGGLADFLKFLGEQLQKAGEFIGFVISLFIPFTLGFKIAARFVGLFSKSLQKLAEFFKPVTDFIKNTFGKGVERLTSFIDRVLGKKASNAVIKAGDAAAGSAKGFGALDDAAKEALKTRDKWETYKKFRLTNDLKFANVEAGVLRTGLGAVSGVLDELNAKRTLLKIDLVIGGATVGEANRFGNLRPNVIDYNARAREYGEALRASLAKVIEEEEDDKEESRGLTPFQERVQTLIDTLTDTLQEARDRIRNAASNFRDAVSLSFGVITNGAFATFDTNRVIRQMKRIKDAAQTFAKDIRDLQRQGADQSLIDELLGMDPLAGSAAARGLLSSGRLDEFLQLRKDLGSIGAGAGGAANFGIIGTGTGGLQSAIEGLTRTFERGAGSTYNINVNNANKMTAAEIVSAIKKYEKTTGKKVFS